MSFLILIFVNFMNKKKSFVKKI